jgi:hypothetical protein
LSPHSDAIGFVRGSRFGGDLACFLNPSSRKCHWLRLVIRLSASFEGENCLRSGIRCARCGARRQSVRIVKEPHTRGHQLHHRGTPQARPGNPLKRINIVVRFSTEHGCLTRAATPQRGKPRHPVLRVEFLGDAMPRGRSRGRTRPANSAPRSCTLCAQQIMISEVLDTDCWLAPLRCRE